MRHLTLLPLVLLCSACLTPREVQPVRLFTLDPQITVPPAARTELTLGVRPLSVARPYEREMVFQGADQVLEYRRGQNWAEKPGTVLTRAISDALIASGRFSDVGNAADMARPDLMLTGELRKFHENRSVSPPVAELELRLELRGARDVRNFWDGTLRAEVPMEETGAAAFAAAMEAAVADVARQAAEAISGAVKP